MTAPHDLFPAIDSFLHTCNCRSTPGLSFWQGRPHVTRAELDMVLAIGREPAGVEAIAGMLACDVASAQALVYGLIGIGLLEQHERGFVATAAALRYGREIS